MMYDNYEADRLAVVEYMRGRGIQYYTTYPANECVGVTFGRVEAYAIVRDGVVVDFIVD